MHTIVTRPDDEWMRLTPDPGQRTLITEPTPKEYAEKALFQLRGSLPQLRQRVRHADFSLLSQEERDEWEVLCQETIALLSPADIVLSGMVATGSRT